jgi:dTDP-4-amino-4,6-dideoxygalactose transaminase
MDTAQVERLISDKTKAIIVVHYAGIACDMDAIIRIARAKNIPIIEDAAQAINSYYKGIPLGSIGAMSAFSFHETKNIISGEGGLLAVNDQQFFRRAEIIWEKGTNRAEFFRGEVNKYGWVDTGSSFLPSEITAAFLYAQLENIERIQNQRINLWNLYQNELVSLEQQGSLKLPVIPDYATNNAHMFYVVCQTQNDRDGLMAHLKKNGVLAVSHYISLHSSSYYVDKHDGRLLPNADAFTARLLRLPLFYELTDAQVKHICALVKSFFA